MRRLARRDSSAQVLGLPMYLIIVMVVAVAIIAAVIAMIPHGRKTINAVVIENPIIAENPGNSSAFTFSNSYDVKIRVTSSDGEPISGATVILLGAGVAESGLTNGEGEVTITIKPYLGENINEDHIKITVKASGFEDYVDEDAIIVYRL